MQKYWKKFSFILGFLCLGLFLSGCSEEKSEDKVKILATTTVVGDVAKHLIGDEIEVDVLMGPGVDPHGYTPTARDVDRILESDLVLVSGLHLEGKMGEVFQGLERKGVGVYALTDGISREKLLEEAPGVYDPHVWWDPVLWADTILPLSEYLGEQFPEFRDLIYKRGEMYREEILNLDAENREKIETIPKERRVLVTAHDAFSYFARAYGFEVWSIQGLNTNDEAGAGKMDSLAASLAEREIPAIFAEKGLSVKSGYGYEAKIGGHLNSDSLGEDGSGEENYVGAVRGNVERVVVSLRGEK